MYRKKSSNWRLHADFIFFDIVFMMLSYMLAIITRSDNNLKGYMQMDIYYRGMFLLAIICFIELVVTNGYDNVLRRGKYVEFVSTFKHVVVVMMFFISIMFIFKWTKSYSRTVFILTGIYSFISIYLVRLFWKLIVNRFKFFRIDTKTDCLIIVSEKSKIDDVLANLIPYNKIRYDIKGIILIDGDDMVGQQIQGFNVVCTFDEALKYMCKSWIDGVLLALDRKHINEEQRILEGGLIMGLVVHQSLGIMADEPGKKQVIDRIGKYTVLSNAINISSTGQLFAKRTMDIIGGIVGTIFTGILFLFVAPAIYIKSPGPIFYKQTRIGQNGKKFKLYKFRSMYMDAEERKAELMKQNKIQDGMMFKIENDPRIIGGENGKGIGNFIRKHSIDEFPQFINVLKGDMSLVGTRPPTEDEWVKYDLHHRKRMAIKPGITGMWQTSGRSDIIDFEEVVKLDAKYITNWSIGLDIKLILKTFFMIFKSDEGSY